LIANEQCLEKNDFANSDVRSEAKQCKQSGESIQKA